MLVQGRDYCEASTPTFKLLIFVDLDHFHGSMVPPPLLSCSKLRD